MAVAAPFVLAKACRDERWHRGLGQRLGLLPDLLRYDNRHGPKIWIHAASVGEVNTAAPFGELLRSSWPDAGIILSTTTTGGQDMASDKASWADETVFLPLDLAPIVNHVVERISPDLFILCETEIWPNLLRSLNSKGVTTALVNGRISDKTMLRYRAGSFFFKDVLEFIDHFAMQSREDSRRIIAAGAPAGRVHTIGNFKFDASLPGNSDNQSPITRDDLGVDPKALLLVAGSTHAPEEELVLDAFQRLSRSHNRLEMILAPRHPQRFDQVADILKQKDIDFYRRSQKNMPSRKKKKVLLLDTLGELARVYALADLVFIGGSFSDTGGHNLLEAAAYGKPVITGPHYENFREITQLMLEHGASIMANDENEFFEELEKLIKDEGYRSEVGESALEVVTENRGGVERTLNFLKDRLRGKATFEP